MCWLQMSRELQIALKSILLKEHIRLGPNISLNSKSIIRTVGIVSVLHVSFM